MCSFWRFGVVHRIAFSNAKRDSDSRKIALRVNLFTSTQRVQFGRSVVAHSAAAQSCGRGPRLKQTQKKEHMCVPFWLFGVVHLNIKKRTLVCSFLAPVEGLGPPTLRLTAECSTD